MADEQERPSVDPAAAAFALGAASDPDMKEDVRAYLKHQSDLAALQVEDMKRADNLRHWSLRVRHVSDVMKMAFEMAIAVILLAVAALVVSALWSAASDRGLVIEAFSVPPGMEARGLSGQVVAAQLQDRLTALQNRTASMRAPSSYENNWGNDIKVQIPETGVSIGDLMRYLHRWLGHATYITGAVYESDAELTVTARTGSAPAASFTGKSAVLDTLMQKAAESVYRQTQPYRYAVYLQTSGRPKEAAAVYTALVAQESATDRAWAYIGLANLAANRGDRAAQQRNIERAIALKPDFVLGLINLDQVHTALQHYEAAYRTERKLVPLLTSRRNADIIPIALKTQALVNQAEIDQALGDFGAARKNLRRLETMPDYGGSVENARQSAILVHAQLHDPAAMRRAIAALPPTNNPGTKASRAAQIFIADVLIGDWQAVLAHAQQLAAQFKTLGPGSGTFLERGLPAIKAYALAMTGRIAEAKALIAPTPMDCDTCLRVRNRIAMAARDWNAAAHWAAMLAAQAPSVPFGYLDWGMALLARGDTAGAIARFRIAHDKGPRFADPLLGWGEALMMQNRSDLALAKFEEAAKYAPNWGRLHLKWGEALLWSGDKAGAKKQFAIAAGLVLTQAEKRQLAKVRARL